MYARHNPGQPNGESDDVASQRYPSFKMGGKDWSRLVRCENSRHHHDCNLQKFLLRCINRSGWSQEVLEGSTDAAGAWSCRKLPPDAPPSTPKCSPSRRSPAKVPTFGTDSLRYRGDARVLVPESPPRSRSFPSHTDAGLLSTPHFSDGCIGART